MIDLSLEVVEGMFPQAIVFSVVFCDLGYTALPWNTHCVQHQICSIKSPCLLISSVASTISLINFLRLMSSVVKPSFFVLFP